jgi:protein TonB
VRPPLFTTLSPLTIAALLASLAAHASVAMYVVNHEAGSSSSSSAADVVTSIDVETIAVAEEAKPEVQPNVVPEAAPRPREAVAPTPDPAHVHAATLRQTPSESAPAAAASVMVAPEADSSPTFAMVIGTAPVAPGGLTKAVGGDQPAPPDAPLPSDGVDELAHLESGPAPSYPSAAKEEGFEAEVPLDIVVDESGRVIDVRATKHLGHGLDESAARAIRDYRFSPAKRGGRAVKVRMRWTVVFRLS